MKPLKFRNGYVILSPIYWACDYLSMLKLKLIHVSKRGYWLQKESGDHQAWNIQVSALKGLKTKQENYYKYKQLPMYFEMKETENSHDMTYAPGIPTLLSCQCNLPQCRYEVLATWPSCDLSPLHIGLSPTIGTMHQIPGNQPHHINISHSYNYICKHICRSHLLKTIITNKQIICILVCLRGWLKYLQ